jgi:hypothetical protein
LIWRNRKKISQIINAYLCMPFFLLIILCKAKSPDAASLVSRNFLRRRLGFGSKPTEAEDLSAILPPPGDRISGKVSSSPAPHAATRSILRADDVTASSLPAANEVPGRKRFEPMKMKRND